MVISFLREENANIQHFSEICKVIANATIIALNLPRCLYSLNLRVNFPRETAALAEQGANKEHYFARHKMRSKHKQHMKIYCKTIDVSYPKAGYLNVSYPNAGYPNAGYPNAGYPNAAYSNADFPNANHPNASNPNACYPNAGYPNAGFPNAVIRTRL